MLTLSDDEYELAADVPYHDYQTDIAWLAALITEYKQPN